MEDAGAGKVERARFGGGWPLGALLAVALWGGSFVFVRVALEGFTPLGLVASRVALATVLLLGIQRLRRERLLPERADRVRCATLGLVFGTHLAIQAFGLRYTSAIHTGWIISFSSVAIALGAHFFLRERLRAIGWAGIVVALVGVGTIAGGAPPGFSKAPWGDALQVLSCFTWAFYSLFGMGPVARNGAVRVTAFAMLVASGPLLALAAGTGFTVGPPDARVLGAVAYLGGLCSAIALVAWYSSQRTHGAQRAAACLYLEPLFTVGAALLVLGETVTGGTAAGGLAVLAGVWLVKRGTGFGERDH